MNDKQPTAKDLRKIIFDRYTKLMQKKTYTLNEVNFLLSIENAKQLFDNHKILEKWLTEKEEAVQAVDSNHAEDFQKDVDDATLRVISSPAEGSDCDKHLVSIYKQVENLKFTADSVMYNIHCLIEGNSSKQ